VSDIQIDALEGRIVNASWRAPVDGGRDGPSAGSTAIWSTWKPADRDQPDRRPLDEPGR
jgi:hypothetical protein